MTDPANPALAYSKALARRAELDPMTGLFNHVAFEGHVCEALARGASGGTFFMIDLDDFKLVNDTLGHPEGDRVIVEFADVLSDVFARDAYVGRMGGDEFACTMPPTRRSMPASATARDASAGREREHAAPGPHTRSRAPGPARKNGFAFRGRSPRIPSMVIANDIFSLPAVVSAGRWL